MVLVLVKGMVKCFFSRLDYVYGVQSNMLMLRLKKTKKHIIFHIIYLYSTPLCPFFVNP